MIQPDPWERILWSGSARIWNPSQRKRGLGTPNLMSEPGMWIRMSDNVEIICLFHLQREHYDNHHPSIRMASFLWNVFSIWIVIRSLSAATLLYAAACEGPVPATAHPMVVSVERKLAALASAQGERRVLWVRRRKGNSSTSNYLTSAKFQDQNVVGSLADESRDGKLNLHSLLVCRYVRFPREITKLRSPAAVGTRRR